MAECRAGHHNNGATTMSNIVYQGRYHSGQTLGGLWTDIPYEKYVEMEKHPRFDVRMLYIDPPAEEQEKHMNSQQIEQGKKDCTDGVPHQAGRGDSYDYGYSVAYAKEQQQ